MKVRQCLKCCEDIDMGWVNVQWGTSLDIGPQHYFPPDAANALN